MQTQCKKHTTQKQLELNVDQLDSVCCAPVRQARIFSRWG